MSERVLQGHHLDTNFKSEELLRFPNDLYTQLKKDFPRNQVNLMRQAYTFASKAHDGQERMDGKPYISHPLEVARILVEMNMDCLLYTSPSPRDRYISRMPSSA